MPNEMFAVILIIIMGFSLVCEYLWLYIVAENQQEYFKRKKRIYNEISTLFTSALGSPLKDIQEKEIQSILDYIDDSNEKYYVAINIYLDYIKKDELSDERKVILDEIYEKLDVKNVLSEKLSKASNNEKGYVIQLMAKLNITDETDNLQQYLSSRNKKLVYYTGMALSQLGDEDGTVEFINICGQNYSLSSRVIMEVLNIYTGNKTELVKKIYDDVDDYLKAVIIKGVKNDKFEELKYIYTKGVKSKSAQIKIACVKALSAFGDLEDEHTLITAMNDRNWVVRLSALEGLEKINTRESLEAIIKATCDDEWWVRRKAAEALVRIDPKLENVEKIIKGYDRYAAEAVKTALSREVN